MAFNDYGNRFQKTSPAVLNLIIANVVAFVAEYVFGAFKADSTIINTFALHPYEAADFKFFQIFTHMFMHGGILHLLLNMYGLFLFGSIVEKVWDPKKFLFFYIVCGVGAALLQLAFYHFELNQFANTNGYQDLLNNSTAVGASGAIMGVVVAFAYLFPNSEMMVIPFPIPIKAKWLVLIIVGIDLFGGLSNRAGDNTAHFAHIGGAITGFLLVYYWNKTNKKTFY